MKAKIILKSICYVLIFFCNTMSIHAQLDAPMVNTVFPDYGFKSMIITGMHTAIQPGHLQYQRKQTSNPIWPGPTGWIDAFGAINGSVFEITDYGISENVSYDYRVRKKQAGSTVVSPPSNIDTNMLSVFWPLCPDLACSNETVDGELQTLIVGFNQPRAYTMNANNPMTQIHSSIDINGILLNPSETVYSSVGGVLAGIIPSVQGAAQPQEAVVIRIRYSGANRFIIVNHLTPLGTGGVPGIALNGTIRPGSLIGPMVSTIWNAENSHIDFNYRTTTAEVNSIDPFILLEEYKNTNNYYDPQTNKPSLNNLDGDADGTTISYKRDNDPTDFYIDSRVLGPIDIIAEISDLQSRNDESGQVAKKIGYYVESLDYIPEPVTANGVASWFTPYLLIDNELGYISSTSHINKFIDNHPDQNAVMPPYHHSIANDGTAGPVSDNYHLNFNYIVTNTKGTNGAQSNLDSDQCWATDARFQPGLESNGYAPGYLKARYPDEAHFAEGNYRVYIVKGDYKYPNEESTQDIIVDNFAPYIMEVIVNSNGQDVVRKYWEAIPAGASNYDPNGPLRFIPQLQTQADAHEQLVITAITSEPLVNDLNLTMTNQTEFGSPTYTKSTSGRLHTFTFSETQVSNAANQANFESLQTLTFSNTANEVLDQIQKMHNSNGGVSSPGPNNPNQVFVIGRALNSSLANPYVATNNNPNAPGGTGVGEDRSHYVEFSNCGSNFTGGDDDQFRGNSGGRATGTCLVPFFEYEIVDGFTVDFTDQSIGNVENYLWDFEVSSSTLQNPNGIDFGMAGTYLVSLTIFDDCGAEETYSTEITLGGDALTAYINGPSTGEIGEPILLFGNATGGTPPYTYSWYFGAGSSSMDQNEQNPVVTYSTAGSKNVTLTIEDSNGQTVTSSHSLIIIGSGMTVDFQWFPTIVSAGIGIPFFSTVDDNVGIITYQWSATGPGMAVINSPTSFSSLINFSADGIYSVSLTVCDQNNCKTVTKDVIVGVNLEFDFMGTPHGEVTPPQGVTFEITTPTEPGYSYYWNFGNGSSTLENPAEVIYTQPGCKTVSLRIEDQYGNSKIEEKFCYIKVGNYEFELGGMGITDNCIGGSPYVYTSFIGGQEDNIDVQQIDNNPPNPCAGEFLRYRNYLLSAQTLAGENLSLFFETEQSPCSYINMDHPALAGLANGEPFTFACTAYAQDFSIPIQTVSETYILTIYPDLTINTETQINACPGTEISLLDIPAISGGIPPYTFQWNNDANFTTGYTLNSPNPVIIVPTVGNNESYTLTVRDSRYSCVTSKTIELIPRKLTVDAGGPTILSCIRQSVATLGSHGTASGGSGSYSYLWSPISNIDNANIANPRVLGSPDGDITYTVLVTDNNGCSATDQVTVSPSESLLTADAGSDQIGASNALCFESTAILGGNPTGQGSNLVGNLAYAWTSTNPSGFASSLPNPTIGSTETSTSGIHTYTIVVSDDGNGCFDEQTVSVEVRPEWEAQGFTTGATNDACIGEAAGDVFNSPVNNIIENSPLGATAPFSYNWSPNNLVNPSNAIVPMPVFTPDANNSFATLLVTDANGCSKSFSSNEWLIYDNKPEVTLSMDGESNQFCAGEEFCIDIVANLFVEDNGATNPYPSITAQWALTPNNENPSSGNAFLFYNQNNNLYEGTLCLTLENPGSKNLNISNVTNPCGTTESNITFTIQSGEPVAGLLQICNNSAGEISSGTYKAIDIVAAEQCAGTIKRKSNVEFIAGTSITLFPGTFQAFYGCNFLGMISTDCFVDKDSRVANETNAEVHELPPSLNLSSENIFSSVFPNPFNEDLKINYTIDSSDSEVSMQIVDITGKTIDVLMKQKLHQQGDFSHVFDGRALTPGIYFCRIQIGASFAVHKIIKAND